MRAAEFSIPVRVYIEDTDAGGIVYYVNYLKYMERARTEYLRARGFHKAAMIGADALFVVHSAQISYRAPARLDDNLVVAAHPQRVTPASLVFAQAVRRGDELLCEAEVRIACVNPHTFRPQRMPDAVHRVLCHDLQDPEGETRS